MTNSIRTEPTFIQKLLLQHGFKLLLSLITLLALGIYGAYTDLRAQITDNTKAVQELRLQLKDSFQVIDKKVDLRDQLIALYQKRIDDHEQRIRALEAR